MPAAISDQIADRPYLQCMKLREADQVVETGHGPVLIHDLADHARGVQPRQSGDIHRGLGMSGSHQHAAIARDERKDMTRGHDLVAVLGGVDRDGNRSRAVGRRDAGRDAVTRLDRYGEGRLVPRPVIAAHRFQAELIDTGLGQREADQPRDRAWPFN